MVENARFREVVNFVCSRKSWKQKDFAVFLGWAASEVSNYSKSKKFGDTKFYSLLVNGINPNYIKGESPDMFADNEAGSKLKAEFRIAEPEIPYGAPPPPTTDQQIQQENSQLRADNEQLRVRVKVLEGQVEVLQGVISDIVHGKRELPTLEGGGIADSSSKEMLGARFEVREGDEDVFAVMGEGLSPDDPELPNKVPISAHVTVKEMYARGQAIKNKQRLQENEKAQTRSTKGVVQTQQEKGGGEH